MQLAIVDLRGPGIALLSHTFEALTMTSVEKRRMSDLLEIFVE